MPMLILGVFLIVCCAVFIAVNNKADNPMIPKDLRKEDLDNKADESSRLKKKAKDVKFK